jgi:hypothetical protein
LLLPAWEPHPPNPDGNTHILQQKTGTATTAASCAAHRHKRCVGVSPPLLCRLGLPLLLLCCQLGVCLGAGSRWLGHPILPHSPANSASFAAPASTQLIVPAAVAAAAGVVPLLSAAATATALAAAAALIAAAAATAAAVGGVVALLLVL